MNIIVLNKNGMITSGGKTVKTDPLICLSYAINLEIGYTLRSYFQMLETYPLLAQMNPFLPAQVDQFRSCPKEHCRSEDLDGLEFSKTIEMVGFPGKPRIEIYSSLQGIRGTETCDIKPLPMAAMLDMTMRLGRLKHVIFGDKVVDTLMFDTAFTLFEWIEGISWELSFHNGPAECRITR